MRSLPKHTIESPLPGSSIWSFGCKYLTVFCFVFFSATSLYEQLHRFEKRARQFQPKKTRSKMNLFHINGTFLANQKACPPHAPSLMLSVCCGACCLLSQLITSPQCARGLWGSHCRLPLGSNSKMQNRLRETSQKESGWKGNIFFFLEQLFLSSFVMKSAPGVNACTRGGFPIQHPSGGIPHREEARDATAPRCHAQRWPLGMILSPDERPAGGRPSSPLQLL